jgi:hypothetical protein
MWPSLNHCLALFRERAQIICSTQLNSNFIDLTIEHIIDYSPPHFDATKVLFCGMETQIVIERGQ